ncbi:hypothetical protein CC80DRAFT_541694 [Byssothecium circinans]|uniref:2EXR domain-containing protein n=1 Tax=Byssothecium circinans TaxID=147558 RepID=A0A6A5URS8_9PLEO|nr:hypothetical protein CC80DRAFT_541694 [Byssothecium circinans]
MTLYIIPADYDPRRRAVRQNQLALGNAQPMSPPPKTHGEYPPLPRKAPFRVVPLVKVLSKFEKLPLEIRERIWEEAMRDERYIAKQHVEFRHMENGTGKTPRFLPQYIHVCKQAMETITAVSIRKSTFMIASVGGNGYFQKFLDSVPGNGRTHVRALQFDYFDYFPPNIAVNRDLSLSAACPGLTKIQMTMHSRHPHILVMREPLTDYYFVLGVLRNSSPATAYDNCSSVTT